MKEQKNTEPKNTKRPRQEVRQERLRTLREIAELLAEEERESDDVIVDARETKTGDKGKQDLSYASSPLAYAIPAYLASCKEPQTAKQIAKALQRAGRDFESDTPVHAIRIALRRMVGKNPDLFHSGWAKWYLKSKCTKAQLEKYLKKNVNFGTGGHGKKAHSKATSDAIQKRISEGKKWGGPKKATPELVERAKEMLRSGMPLHEVCSTLGVAIPTLYQHGLRQRALKKEGELWKGLSLENDNVVRLKS
jgi:hypothetical protein